MHGGATWHVMKP
jgi:hypothetical protein